MEMKDVVLTDDLRKKMAGLFGFRLDGKFLYVPQRCRQRTMDGAWEIPKELWPVFTIRGIDGVESTLAEDNLHGTVSVDESGKSSVTIKSGRHKITTCSRGILTWKNLRDNTGKLIAPPEQDSITGGVTTDALRVLPASLLAELANAINERSTLTEEELLGLE
jgi:hypothetical protein